MPTAHPYSMRPRSREPGLCYANNTHYLSLATDLTFPLLCRAAVQESAFLMLCLLIRSGCAITRVLLKHNVLAH